MAKLKTLKGMGKDQLRGLLAELDSLSGIRPKASELPRTDLERHLEALRSGDAGRASTAAGALTGMVDREDDASPSAFDAMTAALSDTSKDGDQQANESRLVARRAVALNIGDVTNSDFRPRAASALSTALGDEDDVVRKRAQYGLSTMITADAVAKRAQAAEAAEKPAEAPTQAAEEAPASAQPDEALVPPSPEEAAAATVA